MCNALQIAVDGGTTFGVASLRAALTHAKLPERDITEREMSVLVLLANGRNAADIAAELFVSLHTVRNQVPKVSAFPFAGRSTRR